MSSNVSISKSDSNKLTNQRDDFSFPLTRLFDDFFDEFSSKYFKSNELFKKDWFSKSFEYPKMDIISEDGKMLIRAAVPGVEPSDIKIEISKEGVLKISGKSSKENRSENSNYLSKELRMSQFSRTIMLPESIKDKDPTAEIKNGMLTLTWEVPKEQKEPVRSIEIKSS